MDGLHSHETSDDAKSIGCNPTAVETDRSQSLSTDFWGLQQAYQDTCGELDSMNRDIRDQSLEIRDLKRQNAQLHERNALLREENNRLREIQRARPEKLLKSERSKYIEHFEHLDERIAHLQYDRQKRDAYNDK